MTEETLRELYRSRWRREREKIVFTDIRQADFANAVLGQYVPDLTVRLVVLLADPERELIKFDKEFWFWWKTNHENPLDGLPYDWGRLIPTINAAVRFRSRSDDPWHWDSYFALYRHGGLDMGLGRDGGGATRDGQRVFRLIRIVGLLWIAFNSYGLCVERFKINGPWECSVALLRTLNGALSNFATGWLQYPDHEANPYRCPEPNLWRRLELNEWPTQDATKDLAFSFGDWIEDSWGMQVRRFLARSGPLEGKFDISCYR